MDLSRLFLHLVEIDADKVRQGGLAALEAWRAVLPEGVVFLRMLSPKCLHLEIPSAPLVQHIVVKLVLPRESSGLRRLTEAVERSRSHRSHLWAHRLRALGIETPRPLGYVEHGRAPARYPSFAVFEHVGAPTLTELRDGRLSLMPLSMEGLAEKRALIRRVAALLRTMHTRGVFHADLHPGNILVDGDRLLVVDLESVRSFSLPGRATMKNLVRLNRDFLSTRMITRADRMRFLETYLLHEADARTRARMLWAKIRRATERKLLERGEAFHAAT